MIDKELAPAFQVIQAVVIILAVVFAFIKEVLKTSKGKQSEPYWQEALDMFRKVNGHLLDIKRDNQTIREYLKEGEIHYIPNRFDNVSSQLDRLHNKVDATHNAVERKG